MLSDNSAASQRSRILEALKERPHSTIELRRDLDVMMPAARIIELRRRGHQIETFWVDEPTDAGVLHRVARYVLMRRAGGVR